MTDDRDRVLARLDEMLAACEAAPVALRFARAEVERHEQHEERVGLGIDCLWCLEDWPCPTIRAAVEAFL